MKHKNVKQYLFGVSAFLFMELLLAPFSFATDFGSSNFIVKDPVMDEGMKSSTSTNFGLGQSLKQNAIGKSSSSSFQLWSGFQYYYAVTGNTLTATAGNGQVSLSWSVPQTFLGVAVGSYDVGVGTLPGVYVYQSVGNVTSFTKSGLSNGTVYYFKIRAKTSGGTSVSLSNEASAMPNGTTPPVTTGGGGSTPPAVEAAQIIFSGHAYPNSQITLLKDTLAAATMQADSSGLFNVSLKNISAGSYQFVLYAKDAEGRRSPLVSVPYTLHDGQIATVDSVLLGPTISIDKSKVKQGDSLEVTGYAAANSPVTIHITAATELLYQLIASGSGRYSFRVPTNNLPQGSYSVRSSFLYGQQASPYSQSLDFIVGKVSVPVTGPVSCPAKADFNNDCRVNLVDFSILAYWYSKLDAPKNIDLNTDGKIDLVDFSILAYYWTD